MATSSRSGATLHVWLTGVVLVALLGVAVVTIPESALELAPRTDLVASTGVAAAARGTVGGDGDDTRGAADAIARTRDENVASAAVAQLVPDVPREHVLVRVVDATTQEPVADAEVAASRVDPKPLTAAEQREQARLGDSFERLARFGQSARSDANGCVVLSAATHLTVAARHGERFGKGSFFLTDIGPRGFELRVRHQELVTVRAVDRLQRPLADLPIGLLATYAHPAAPDGEEAATEVGRTDDAGSLTFRLTEHLREISAPRTLAVFVRAPGLTSTRSVIDADRRVAPLVLDTFGEVHVRVADSGGRELDDDPAWNVTLMAISGFPDAVESTEDAAKGNETGTGGRAVFRYVGLGVGLFARAHVQGLPLEQRFAGPTSHGQRVEQVLALAAVPQFVVRGRIVDAGGQPLPWAHVRVAGTHGDHASCVGDEQGRIRARWKARGKETAATVRLVVTDGRRFRGISAPVAAAVGAEKDLGDVRVVRGETIATGELVEERPRPAGLALLVSERRHDDWQAAIDVQAVLDDDGKFTVVSDRPLAPARMQLLVHAPGCDGIEPIEFQGGAHLRVVLRNGLLASVRVLLAPDLLRAAERGSLFLVATDTKENADYWNGRVIDDAWVVERHGCRPGRYKLEIEGPGSVTAATLADVEFGAGVPPDPRLSPWDLREALQVLEVKVFAPDGTPFRSSYDVHAKPESDGWLWCGADGPGAECIVARRPYDIVVAARAGGYVRHNAAMDTVVVTMPAATRMRLTLDGLPDLVADAPLEFGVRVRDEWHEQHDLPTEANPISDCDFDRAKRALTFSLFEPVDAVVRIARPGDEDTVLATLPCTLAPSQREVTVVIPEATRQALLPWTVKPK
jgi:hypothetical protein